MIQRSEAGWEEEKPGGEEEKGVWWGWRTNRKGGIASGGRKSAERRSKKRGRCAGTGKSSETRARVQSIRVPAFLGGKHNRRVLSSQKGMSKRGDENAFERLPGAAKV